MANPTTSTQRRDRRRELEEKYGLRSTTSTSRDDQLLDLRSGQNFYYEFILYHNKFIIETRQLRPTSISDEPLIGLNQNQIASSNATILSGRKLLSIQQNTKRIL